MLTREHESISVASWELLIGEDGVYSVKARYQYFCNNILPDTHLMESVCKTMKNLWFSLAPQKLVFSRGNYCTIGFLHV
jgi:hypothetical protein